MFSGIVEGLGRVAGVEPASGGTLRITVEIPPHWDDLKSGDSIAHDGVCLTVETLKNSKVTFLLGLETLNITQWSQESLLGSHLNLERSLKLGDRVHGHLVLGHVDGRGRVESIEDRDGAFRKLIIKVPEAYAPYLWKKGSITLNGVSLTINSVEGSLFEVGLIPETLARTNLKDLKIGDYVLFEVDYMARGLVHQEKLKNQSRPQEVVL